MNAVTYAMGCRWRVNDEGSVVYAICLPGLLFHVHSCKCEIIVVISWYIIAKYRTIFRTIWRCTLLRQLPETVLDHITYKRCQILPRVTSWMPVV